MPDWQSIVSQDGPAAWRTAYRLLGNRADADECFQETCLAALAVSRREVVHNWRGLFLRLTALPLGSLLCLPGDHPLAIGRGQRTGGQGGRARGRTGGGAQRQQRDGQRRDGQPDGGGTGSFVHRGRGDLWSDGASSRLSIQG